MFMLPFNVVLVGHLKGFIRPSEVAAALAILCSRHPMLAVRVQIEDDDSAFLTSENVPIIQVNTEPRDNTEQWLECIKKEFQTPFSIQTGPLVRCTLVCSDDECEIILCGHHIVCDGISLGYMLRDLLNLISQPTQNLGEPLIPPPVDKATVQNPPSSNWFIRFIMEIINKRWETKGVRFSESDMRRMHEIFWEHNSDLQLLAWNLDTEDTARLVQRSRAKRVTVNSALWTAFLAAQDEVQSDRLRYRQRSALAVSTRDKLLVPAGEAFGFFASSLTVDLPYFTSRSFWDNARTVHERIENALAKTNLFRMLSSELIHPTLLDSLYYRKYGMLKDSMPNKLLRKMKWHEISYGYALTNVGRLNIPTSYGSLELKAVYGPLFYSDVEEKMLGVITVGGRLSFLHISRRSVVGDADRLKDTAMSYLKAAIGKTPN